MLIVCTLFLFVCLFGLIVALFIVYSLAILRFLRVIKDIPNATSEIVRVP